jgi:hypothetical protein
VAVILLSDGSLPFQDAWNPSVPGVTQAPVGPLMPLPKIGLLPGAPNEAGPGLPTVFDEPPPKPEPGTWEAVPLAHRAAGLGVVGPTVNEFLAELQDQIAMCSDEETVARFGQVRVARAKDGSEGGTEGPTLLVLQMVTRPGAVIIEDAPVQAQGSASDGLIACAQQILRGQVIPTPGSQAGPGRMRMVFAVVP